MKLLHVMSKAFDRVWHAGLFLPNSNLTEFHVEYLTLVHLFSVIDSFACFWMESHHQKVCQLGGLNPTYERYILGLKLVNSLGFLKNVSHFDFSSLCVFYRPESLQTGIFLKYIDHTYMVIRSWKQKWNSSNLVRKLLRSWINSKNKVKMQEFCWRQQKSATF